MFTFRESLRQRWCAAAAARIEWHSFSSFFTPEGGGAGSDVEHWEIFARKWRSKRQIPPPLPTQKMAPIKGTAEKLGQSDTWGKLGTTRVCSSRRYSGGHQLVHIQGEFPSLADFFSSAYLFHQRIYIVSGFISSADLYCQWIYIVSGFILSADVFCQLIYIVSRFILSADLHLQLIYNVSRYISSGDLYCQ